MELKIAHNDVQSMSQDGAAILRSLQNKTFSVIDLIVRESLQNSLDATSKDMTETFVDFKVGQFPSFNLAKHFKNIDTKLIEKFPGNQDFIAISDYNTDGLTGDYKSNSQEELNNSNFHKLVFGIGKNQNKDGAGGSWGLGKTSYFRVGIGIVIYYTRIKTAQGFEERLIASLIESPKQDARLLPNSERGIAWWGELDTVSDKIYPLTNGEDISEILDIFNINRYEGDKTGTTIIIPYLLPHENDMIESKNYPWELDREKAIDMAVQRWYFPRIINKAYEEKLGNSSLYCTVNGKIINPLTDPNFEASFKILRDLYTSALTTNPVNDCIHVEKVKIPLRALEKNDEPIGHVAFCEVSREEAQMMPPNNKFSPLAYFGVKDASKMEAHNSKVLAYCRKPGMVVEYNVDGDWLSSVPTPKDDHMLFAFFVPNSYAKLAGEYHKKGYETVEQYLRATENSDHATWADEDGITLIQRTKKYTSKAVSEVYRSDEEKQHTSATSALARKYGKKLMPRKNFGKTSASRQLDSKTKRKVEARERVSDISVTRSEILNESNILIEFKVFLKKQSKSEIYVQVLTQDKSMNYEEWKKNLGDEIAYPFMIKDVVIKTVDGVTIDKPLHVFTHDQVQIEIDKDTSSVIAIKSSFEEGLDLEGTFVLNLKSNQYVPTVSIKTVATESEVK